MITNIRPVNNPVSLESIEKETGDCIHKFTKKFPYKVDFYNEQSGFIEVFLNITEGSLKTLLGTSEKKGDLLFSESFFLDILKNPELKKLSESEQGEFILKCIRATLDPIIKFKILIDKIEKIDRLWNDLFFKHIAKDISDDSIIQTIFIRQLNPKAWEEGLDKIGNSKVNKDNELLKNLKAFHLEISEKINKISNEFPISPDIGRNFNSFINIFEKSIYKNLCDESKVNWIWLVADWKTAFERSSTIKLSGKTSERDAKISPDIFLKIALLISIVKSANNLKEVSDRKEISNDINFDKVIAALLQQTAPNNPINGAISL